MVDYLQGRRWATGDDIVEGVFNTSSKGGIVHALDSGGLQVDIERLDYILDSVTKAYAGATSQAVTLSASNYLYLNISNALIINTTGFPVSGSFYALAIATTNATKVLQITQIGQSVDSIASGITSVTANSPLVQTGTAAAPIIDLPDSTALATGAMTAAQFTKLSNVETAADVTDATNVAAAGAVMESLVTTIGDLLVGDAVGSIDLLVAGALGQVVTSNGPGTIPTYQTSTAFTAAYYFGIGAGASSTASIPLWAGANKIESGIAQAADGIFTVTAAGVYSIIVSAPTSTGNAESLTIRVPAAGTTITGGHAHTNYGQSGYSAAALVVLGASGTFDVISVGSTVTGNNHSIAVHRIA